MRCNSEPAKLFAQCGLATLRWISIVVPFLEDSFDDMSAGAVGEDDEFKPWYMLFIYVLSALIVNVTSLIYDSHRLHMGEQDEAIRRKTKLGKCQANRCCYSCDSPVLSIPIFMVRFLIATAVLTYYAYITTEGMLMDYRPYQLQALPVNGSLASTAVVNQSSPVLLSERLLSLLPDDDLRHALNLVFATLSALVFVLLEGFAGWLFYIGDFAFKDTAIALLKPCWSRLGSKNGAVSEQPPESDGESQWRKIIRTFNHLRFWLGLLSVIAFSFSVFVSLFDGYCIVGETAGSPTLYAKRALSFVLSVLYGLANVDYYLAELAPEWVGSGVRHWAYRLLAILGMAAYYFALDMNRFVQLTALYSGVSVLAGTSLYIGALAYALTAGAAVGALRYGLSWRSSVQTDETSDKHLLTNSRQQYPARPCPVSQHSVFDHTPVSISTEGHELLDEDGFISFEMHEMTYEASSC